jgi:glycosyltransferase involved in cell wall biosynthesis
VGADAVSYVHPDSPAEFAAAVRALEDPDLWKARSRRSLERAADFSWDDSARRLLLAAEEAVALRARHSGHRN